ncbi:MAG: serine/threonine protein kinase, partial [Labilithrix sp.]|nr:serine/threonine protein kinase [Labilithrix sp.]
MTYPLATDEHLLVLLGAVSDLARELAFDRTVAFELDLALREIGSNALRHGGGGTASIRAIQRPGAWIGADNTSGIEVTISDDGPGIPDVDAAFVDGYSTRRGLGVGLGAARRL